MALDGGARQEVITVLPGKPGGRGHGNLIAVTYAYFERVGILRPLLLETAAATCHRDAKRLAPEGEQIASALKLAENRAPVRSRKGGTVR
jgi:hypothetical protein